MDYIYWKKSKSDVLYEIVQIEKNSLMKLPILVTVYSTL